MPRLSRDFVLENQKSSSSVWWFWKFSEGAIVYPPIFMAERKVGPYGVYESSSEMFEIILNKFQLSSDALLPEGSVLLPPPSYFYIL